MTLAAPEGNLIELRGVGFRRGNFRVFDGLDMAIPKGKVTAVMGPSGTGKTTLLRLITGQLKPDAGSVRVGEYEVPSLSLSRLYEMRRQMGMLFQNGALLTDFSVFENVAFPLREHTRLPDRLIRHIVLTKLHAVGLRGAAELFPGELSGGMNRRVALARAIVMDPDILIYDEPFVGLDPISMGVIVRLIRRLNDALGLTSVVVSHDVRELELVADHSFLLAEGRVVASGAHRELMDEDSPLVRQFMHGEADGPVAYHFPAKDYGDDLFDRGQGPR